MKKKRNGNYTPTFKRQVLACDLQAEFPGRNGFSARNLWNMRDFYRSYSELPKHQPLVREISWAKNLVILGRVKDPLEREFYLRATARFGWTKAVLQHQIDNQSYAKYLLNQTNFRFPDPVALGVGIFHGVRLGDQSKTRMAKNNPPCPPCQGESIRCSCSDGIRCCTVA